MAKGNSENSKEEDLVCSIGFSRQVNRAFPAASPQPGWGRQLTRAGKYFPFRLSFFLEEGRQEFKSSFLKEPDCSFQICVAPVPVPALTGTLPWQIKTRRELMCWRNLTEIQTRWLHQALRCYIELFSSRPTRSLILISTLDCLVFFVCLLWQPSGKLECLVREMSLLKA